jgi:AmiR/NasT family two-component response regulator
MTTNSNGDATPIRSKSPIRIVVAEDEALIRMDLVEMLRDAGYEVVALSLIHI